MIANVLHRVRSGNFQKRRFRTTVGLSMEMLYECEAAGTFEAALAS